MQVEVSIIIVNYNTFDLTVNCLESVFSRTKGVLFEVILVDNKSTNCDPRLFLERFPDINLIVSSANLGFAGGNNLGVKNANGKYLLLLNSDTEIVNDAVTIAVDFMKKNQTVGALSGQVIYPNGRAQGIAGRFPSLKTELYELTRLNSFLSSREKIKKHLGERWDYSRPTEADWIWGTFFCIPREVLSRFPNKKFHEDFFMYYEDVLWCYYIKTRLNLQVMYIPEPLIVHFLSGSSFEKDHELNFKTKILPNQCRFLIMEKGCLYTALYYFVKGLHYISLRSTRSFKMGVFYFEFLFKNVLKRYSVRCA